MIIPVDENGLQASILEPLGPSKHSVIEPMSSTTAAEEANTFDDQIDDEVQHNQQAAEDY